jgi:hypothetical protein
MVIDNEDRQQALQCCLDRSVVIARTRRQSLGHDQQFLEADLIHHHAIDPLAVALAGAEFSDPQCHG